jgi:hypothetical protein
MLKLPDVTLVCIDGSYHDLSTLAIRKCMKHAQFGDVLTVSHRPLVPEARHVTCEIKGLQDAMRILWYKVPEFIKTSHFLVMQWDSWIINPWQWTNDFLQYDYIGAPWGYSHYNVGNGGFSLRSKELALALRFSPGTYPLLHPEDDALCRLYRHSLEQEDFRWPPDDIARRFSFECTGPIEKAKHFGFHCLRNWPYVLTREELAERLMMCPDHVKRSSDFADAVRLGRELGSRCGVICAF